MKLEEGLLENNESLVNGDTTSNNNSVRKYYIYKASHSTLPGLFLFLRFMYILLRHVADRPANGQISMF